MIPASQLGLLSIGILLAESVSAGPRAPDADTHGDRIDELLTGATDISLRAHERSPGGSSSRRSSARPRASLGSVGTKCTE